LVVEPTVETGNEALGELSSRSGDHTISPIAMEDAAQLPTLLVDVV
jgi:hypothetical protein